MFGLFVTAVMPEPRPAQIAVMLQWAFGPVKGFYGIVLYDAI
jgi:hypothetical protein